MSTIARYITKELISNLLLGIFVLSSVFLTIDFLGRVWEFLDNGISITVMAEYFFAKLPWIVYKMIPISCLMATLLTFSDLSRHNETVAMFAGGISIWRIGLIIGTIGFIVTGLSFLLNEFVVPRTTARVKYVQEVHVKKRNYQAFKKNKIWYRSKNLIYNLQFFEPEEKIIHGITIYFFDDNFKIIKQITAQKAKWENNNWKFYDGTEIDFRSSNYPRLRDIKEEIIYLPEKPEDLTVIEKSTDTISLMELKEYVHKSKRAGLKSRVYEVDMHSKIALPFACIIMMLLALPFAIKHKRGGGIAVNLGYTFVFVLAYVFIQAIVISYGHNGKLQPIVAAWFTNGLFALFATFAISKIRT